MDNNEKKEEQKQPKMHLLVPITEKPLSQQLEEMPYSTERIGQGFAMNWTKPKESKKDSEK